MNNKLIAIVTCHAPKYRERADAQRQTWAKHAAECGFDLKFVLGRPPLNEKPAHDEIFLDVDDGYNGMPAKVQALYRWAMEDYDYVFKTDDDVYVNMIALKHCPHEPHDYVGRFRGPSGGYPADYASGYGYWVSRRAMRTLAHAPLNGDWAEDRWVANTLAKAGIRGHRDDIHYVACYPPLLPEVVWRSHIRSAAAFCEYPPHLMLQMYKHHLSARVPIVPSLLWAVSLPSNIDIESAPTDAPPGSKPEIVSPKKQTIVLARKPMNDLTGKLCILLKTFLRDGMLFDTVDAMEHYFPEIRMVIMDDGRATPEKDKLYARLRAAGHTCEYLPFDSGFGAKANAAIKYLDRPYVLVGADDFDFADTDQSVRCGVERMVTVIESDSKLGVASGRVDNNPYEGFLSYGDNWIRETPLKMGNWEKTPNGTEFLYCDITVNYSVLRASMLGLEPGKVSWEEIYKIGGEHHDFFQDVKRCGWKVAFVPGANINQAKYDPNKCDPTYNLYRGRAWDCVGKFVLKHCDGKVPDKFLYIGFDGSAHDYVDVAKQRKLL